MKRSPSLARGTADNCRPQGFGGFPKLGFPLRVLVSIVDGACDGDPGVWKLPDVHSLQDLWPSSFRQFESSRDFLPINEMGL